MNPAISNRRSRHFAAPIGMASLLVLAGCASTPPVPTAALQSAQQAITAAERSDAGRYAPSELSAARSRLASADAAVAQKKMVVAARYAEQSRAEAELATARTSAAKATAVNLDMKRSTGALVEEMQRSSGVKP